MASVEAPAMIFEFMIDPMVMVNSHLTKRLSVRSAA
jgi:hypothetical protein